MSMLNITARIACFTRRQTHTSPPSSSASLNSLSISSSTGAFKVSGKKADFIRLKFTWLLSQRIFDEKKPQCHSDRSKSYKNNQYVRKTTVAWCYKAWVISNNDLFSADMRQSGDEFALRYIFIFSIVAFHHIWLYTYINALIFTSIRLYCRLPLSPISYGH